MADHLVPCRVVVKNVWNRVEWSEVKYLQCFLCCREVERTTVLHVMFEVYRVGCGGADWIVVCG